MLNKAKIVKELSLKSFGAKGWMSSPNLPCMACGKKNKLGFLIENRTEVTHCFYCGNKTPVKTYLIQLGRQDLIQYDHDVDISLKLPENSFNAKSSELDLFMENKSAPLGFHSTTSDPYLDGRGFTPHQYKLFNVGVSEIDPKVRNKYVIFLLKNGGNVVGWLARSRKPKQWHDQNLKAHKQKGERLYLRYYNSPFTDFSRYIGGFDEITPETHTVIITEGLFDKAATDRKLELYDSPGTKCIYTFGNKISKEQIAKLKQKNVKKVILLYDNGTIVQSKQYALTLSNHWDSYIADIKQKDGDPDSITQMQLLETITNLRQPFEFNFNKIQSQLLV